MIRSIEKVEVDFIAPKFLHSHHLFRRIKIPVYWIHPTPDYRQALSTLISVDPWYQYLTYTLTPIAFQQDFDTYIMSFHIVGIIIVSLYI